MKNLLTISIATLTLLSCTFALHASTISTFPAFASRTTDQTFEYPYPLGQTFIATPGTVSMSSFTFYVSMNPPPTKLTFSLFQWDPQQVQIGIVNGFGDQLFTGTPTMTPYVDPSPPSGSPGYWKVTMDTGALPVTPGLGYVAGLQNQGDCCGHDTFAIASTGTDLYSVGYHYGYKTRGFLLYRSPLDAVFTATFVGGVDQIYGQDVPEPKLGAIYFAIVLALLVSVSGSLAKNRRANFGDLTTYSRLAATPH